MIHPSYSELIQMINNNEEDEQPVVNSRYSLVLATSRRARQIIGGSAPLVPGSAGKKPLSIAIDEIYKGEVRILADDAPAQEAVEEEQVLEEQQAQEEEQVLNEEQAESEEPAPQEEHTEE
mgnify:CR=1 FL=1